MTNFARTVPKKYGVTSLCCLETGRFRVSGDLRGRGREALEAQEKEQWL